MAGNKSWTAAKKAKNDEFFTRREDIENELSRYADSFRDKVVYCNCDDPTWSEFWQFFMRNFRPWGLKKLMATHYEPDEKNFADEPTVTQIPCNGDFRSAYCIDLLKQADIVVTNPPFSLFREYVAQLIEYKKDFVIIGPQNAIVYKEIFPLLMDNKMWLGYGFNKGDAYFRIPADKAGEYAPGVYDPDTGLVHFRNCAWFTNLDIPKRHEFIDLRGNYYDPEQYPKYDNYDAIEVSKVADIPCDYDGMMGVPISFMDRYCPEQFEIVGMPTARSNEGSLNLGKDYSKHIGYKQNGEKTGRTGSTFGACPVFVRNDGKAIYYTDGNETVQAGSCERVFIRLRNPEPRRYPDDN